MNWEKVAKEKDDGTFAIYGMKKYLSECSNLHHTNAECITYIIETFLECIDSVDFLTWLKDGNHDGRPIILNRATLKSHFKDLLQCSDNLEVISDLFMYLYDVDMWVDSEMDCLYTTIFTIDLNNRKKLDFITIAQQYERISTLLEYNQLKWSEIHDIIDTIVDCGYDIKSNYKYLDEDIETTVNNIRERLQEVFLFNE